MTNDDTPMPIEDYLASGGKLTSPDNVPPRYRAEVLRMMAIFVDSELAGAAGFAGLINAAPGVTQRIASARIVLEKNQTAERILRVMADFGTDTDRYANSHPWADRLPRDALLNAKRSYEDMRLPVFNAPFDGWEDAVVMNLLMGLAVGVLLQDYRNLSYLPLAETFREVEPVEQTHTDLAREGLATLVENGASLQSSVDYWWPRVAASFGTGTQDRDTRLRKFGLRNSSNDALRNQWVQSASDVLCALNLHAPKL
ncbi:1,2-phenylacetyl-CoA epoxidase catalytic subunit [Sulfitobacter undariae]|uniref:1,2-phenylacetyl-CoA epoxidase catalytic subunit n=1 Tax=Sulfitobacter undariae TaxID=1563671 RepID=A0A7W6H285_9RHOB|nr:Phenylacetic acid catabolic protein [Sulfitobacter undariae]MBB3995568.1 1,2-phenylacetyl-CoA epoxidase catalytic subunit [Sulfitobacter undariae]